MVQAQQSMPQYDAMLAAAAAAAAARAHANRGPPAYAGAHQGLSNMGVNLPQNNANLPPNPQLAAFGGAPPLVY